MTQYIYYQGKQYPIPIQYSLPKGINSVEAGLLVDGTLEDEDILSIFYEWAQKGIVKIVKRGNNINIIKAAGLPDDAKVYERYIYRAFFDGIAIFKDKKINLATARILVIDYCFKKGWIQDFTSEMKNINRATKWLVGGTIIWFFVFLFYIIINMEELGIPTIIIYIFLCMVLFFSRGGMELGLRNANKIYIDWAKRVPIKYTQKGTKLVAELLGYKKYLDQIKLSCKNKNTKESILMKDGTANHNIVLKSSNIPNIMELLKKKYTYTNVKVLWKCYNKFSNRFDAYWYVYFYDNDIS